MNRRDCLRSIGGGMALSSLAATRSADAQSRGDRLKNKLPHIIIFNPDQFRADALGHLGNPAAVTPNLDRMAETDGVSFSHAFCQNPVCTPSRCSFMTGWYTHVRGHRTMHHMLHADEPMLLQTLKKHGYHVWWGGKNDVVPAQYPDPFKEYATVKYAPSPDKSIRNGLHADQSWRAPEGTKHYYSFYAGCLDKKEEPIYYDSDLDHVTAACEMIDNAPEGKPLCIYLPLTYPHPPYGVEEPYYSAIDRKKIPKRLPVPKEWIDKPSILKRIHKNQNLHDLTEKDWTELRAVYLGMCARIDDQFGMVLDALRRNGMYDDTAVFFFSDHGDYTGDYGLVEKAQNTFEDVLTRVPFLIKPPSWVKAEPGVRDALVELIDFPATVEALTGIEPEHWHFGRSLLPLVADETDTHRDAVFCEGGQLIGENHTGERMTPHGQDHENLYYPRVSIQRIDGPEISKSVMCRTETHKYVRRLYEKDELYDLVNDPGELVNRIDDQSCSDVLAELRERLLTHMLETGDVVPLKADSRWPGEILG